MTTIVRNKPETSIQSPAIARGTDKITHQVFYVVQSDSHPNTWYTVRWNNERLMWCCNCPARCSGCKHTRAVNEILKIRRQRIAQAMGPQTVEVVAKLQAQEDAKRAEQAARREAYCQEFGIYE